MQLPEWTTIRRVAAIAAMLSLTACVEHKDPTGPPEPPPPPPDGPTDLRAPNDLDWVEPETGRQLTPDGFTGT
jgi:hypothetical protein